MPVPIVFRKADEELITFNFLDIVAGKTYAHFYAIVDDLATANRIMSTRNLDTPEHTLHNGNYDILIDKPVYIGGKAILNMTRGLYVAGAGGWAEIYEIYKISHYDGTTETQLGIGQSQVLRVVTGTSPNPDYQRNVISFDLTKKKFKKGDYIRFNVAIHASTNSGSYWSKVYCDAGNNTPIGPLNFKEEFNVLIPILTIQG